MKRIDFIKTAILTTLTLKAIKLNALNKLVENYDETEKMPVLFVGHGSPMNAIEDNIFSREMKRMGKEIPKPKAILMISAHWETKGTFVTAMEKPKTIHDFGGFPQTLFDVQYPAPGSKWLAEETKQTIKKTDVGLDETWGFDHGGWSVTKNMFPEANIPMIQLSLDYTKPAQYHYELAKELAGLRKKGVLITGSGNMVHNLGMIAMKSADFNAPYGHDWAIEANEIFKKHILAGNHQPLINYSSLGKAVQLSIPTPEHYLPLLYTLALKEEKENLTLLSDVLVGGSVSMTSVKIGG
ncbi:MAG: 4,5-DOPA dioxygenase extradiol [Bacteroidia bacterium]|nr:4,5-DOPA dioxygenase extradiol [Bacteroidia bacterium]